MDQVKDAFRKVKLDMDSLKNELDFIKKEINELKNSLKNNTFSSTHNPQISTHDFDTSTHNPSLEALKHQNLGISTGNQGVPTDRQTDRQTNRQTNPTQNKEENSFEGALDILNSLDNIKKEVRLKFKRLTDQEFIVFSEIYQLDQELGYADYKILSERLNLTESSIRDYVGRLIKKQIPLEKVRVNNKNIQIIISDKLKKIASFQTILQLRDL